MEGILIMNVRTSLWLSAATLSIAASGIAHAQTSAAPAAVQDAASDDSASFGDIVVTARRRGEQLSKVPLAVSAFSGDVLAAKGINNTEDLTRITPGLAISSAGSKGVPFVVIRGQSRAVTGNGAPGVIVYINDVPMPNAGALIQNYDMENIQVLKGPQGTLFGRNAIGGAILTVTKAPDYKLGGYVSGTLAQYNTYQGEAALNIPIVKDHVALRLAAQLGQSGMGTKTYLYSPFTVSFPGGVPTYTPGDLTPSQHGLDEYQTRSYRASLLVEPTDWLKNVTVGDYSKIRGLPAVFAFASTDQALYDKSAAAIKGALTPAAGSGFANLYADSIIAALAQCGANGPGPAASGPINCNIFSARAATANSLKERVSFTQLDPYLTRTIIKGVTNTTTITIAENLQVKNIFAYRETDNFQNASIVGVALPILPTALSRKLKQTSEELQIAGTLLNGDLKYTVGGFYLNESPNGAGGSESNEVNAFFGLQHTFISSYVHNKSKALYGQFDYSLDKFLPGVTITGGLRQTWDSQSVCTSSQSPLSPFASPLAPMIAIKTADDLAAVVGTEAQCQANAGVPGLATNTNLPEAKFKKLTYTIGANWRIDDDAMVYVTHRRGYRAGGYNTPAYDTYLASVQTFAPETLTDFEIGAKLKFRSGDMRGSLNVALFTGKDDGYQLPVSTSNLGNVCVPQAIGTPGHPTSDCTTLGGVAGSVVRVDAATTLVNAGKLTIRGFEVDATFSPIPLLEFNANAAYVDVRTDQLSFAGNQNFANFAAATVTAAGEPRVKVPASVEPQGQPRWTANAGVTVNYPDKVLGGNLSGNFDFHYNASYRVVEIDVPASKQADIRLNLEDVGGTGLNLQAWVKNVFNRTNFSGAAATSRALGTLSYQLADQRTLGMTARYSF
jgi:iron complex outermembrane receptor protein